MLVYQPGFLEEILKPFNLRKDDTSPTPATDKLFTNTSNYDLGDEKKFRSVLMKLMFSPEQGQILNYLLCILVLKCKTPLKLTSKIYRDKRIWTLR